ncbi:MAG: GAF domain-containing protein [Chloroflexota bacterium]
MNPFRIVQGILRPFRNWRLQYRLIALLVIVMLPLVSVIPVFARRQIVAPLETEALEELEAYNRVVANSTQLWLDFSTATLLQMVHEEEIFGMDAAEQELALKAVAELHPYMYLVSTTNLSGMNVARSDGNALTDYSDRYWFQQARNGVPLTYQILIGRTSKEPALVVSTPIRDGANNIVGVGMFASDLGAITRQIEATVLGQTGSIYVIDEKNQIFAHPDPSITSAPELIDASDYPAVIKLRNGETGPVAYEDENGLSWRAYITLLDNGWAVIAQQSENEVYQTAKRGQLLTFTITLASALVILVLVGFVVTQIVMPISQLTETATAIAAGELDRRAPVESRDEIGRLGRAFNAMTEQLRHNMASLERQVSERTAELQARTVELEASARELEARSKELDERSTYLQTAVDVNRFVSTILDPDLLMVQVVELIRERFNLYYVGLFLVDSNRERAWLKAGTGEAGRNMLERRHAIRIGSGMVGWAIENARPRIALHADEDQVRLATPDLPKTRSEAALPLRSRDTVIGALTIQSALPDDFNDENIAVFQILADQVAIAIDNARLYSESQGALEALQSVYTQQTQESWARLGSTMAFRSDAVGVARAGDVWYPEMETALKKGEVIVAPDAHEETAGQPLAVPIKVRGQVVGVLDARRDTRSGQWGDEDIGLIQTIVEQLGVALESAQLYQETQSRAERERLVAQITSKLRASNDPQAILQTAASELRRALRVKDARVLLRKVPPQERSDDDAADMPDQPVESEEAQAPQTDTVPGPEQNDLLEQE